MEHFLYIILGLATLSLVLGFIALLTQKIYIDEKTLQPTNISIPLIGKMKTNYPSLVFVFAGLLLVYFAMNKLPLPTENHVVSGVLQSSKEDVKWTEGELVVSPSKMINKKIWKNGRFEITYEVEKGKRFDEVVDSIKYTLGNGSVRIHVNDEYKLYFNDRTKSLIHHVGKRITEYKPASLHYFGDWGTNEKYHYNVFGSINITHSS